MGRRKPPAHVYYLLVLFGRNKCRAFANDISFGIANTFCPLAEANEMDILKFEIYKHRISIHLTRLYIEDCQTVASQQTTKDKCRPSINL